MVEFPTLVDGVEMQDAGEETLVHDPNSKRIHVLNTTAAIILRACNGSRSISELARLLDEDGSPQAEQDAQAIVAQFGELGLVR